MDFTGIARGTAEQAKALNWLEITAAVEAADGIFVGNQNVIVRVDSHLVPKELRRTPGTVEQMLRSAGGANWSQVTSVELGPDEGTLSLERKGCITRQDMLSRGIQLTERGKLGGGVADAPVCPHCGQLVRAPGVDLEPVKVGAFPDLVAAQEGG